MKLLCVGDVAISAVKVSTKLILPQEIINPGKTERILLNWEFPIGSNLNENPRNSGPRIIVNPVVTKIIDKFVPGFVSLATNHMLDAGFNGINETKKELEKIGFYTVGAGLSIDEISKSLFWETEEGKLTIINWVFPETNPDWELVPGVNCWPGIDSAQDIIRHHKKNSDWVILSLHWSDELFYFPRPEDRNIAQKLSIAGADIIVGHHPHICRGFEIINQCTVFYSLGNFFFSDFQISDGNWIRQAPLNKISLGVLISFENSQIPLYQCILFQQKKDEISIKPIKDLEKRIDYLNKPLIEHQENSYLNWYNERKKIFFGFEAKWEFGYRKLGFIGSISYLFKKIKRFFSCFFENKHSTRNIKP